MPVVPLLVLSVVINAPAIVDVALMLKEVAVVAFEPLDAALHDGAGRVEAE